jgi:hypothetical protein
MTPQEKFDAAKRLANQGQGELMKAMQASMATLASGDYRKRDAANDAVRDALATLGAATTLRREAVAEALANGVVTAGSPSAAPSSDKCMSGPGVERLRVR